MLTMYDAVLLTHGTTCDFITASTATGNSAGKERDTDFGNDNFGASCYRPVGNARSMDASASSSHSHRW